MNCHDAVEFEKQCGSPLVATLSDAGIGLLYCAMDGAITGMGSTKLNATAQGSLAEWFTGMACASPLFRQTVAQAASQWSVQRQPGPIEAMPGMWLIPMPTFSRRRRSGYAVALVVTEALLAAEQLSAICQTTRTDFELCTKKIHEMLQCRSHAESADHSGLRAIGMPVIPSDIARAAALVRAVHKDDQRAANDAQAIEAVGKQLAESYEEMNLLYTITQNMTVQERPERFVAQACTELLNTLPYAWIGLQLADDRERLKAMSGRLILAGDAEQSGSTLRTIAQALLRSADPDTPMVLEPATNPRHAMFAPLGRTVLVQPVADPRDRSVLGLLLAGEKRGPDTTASNIDIKLLGATATHMAIFLENAALYDDLNAMFLGTLEALTASIDAKDRYTCGHSRRVAHLTQTLAQKIGLDEYTVSRCHIAGMVHDVGKIGVPEHVLLKPGRLTEEEFGWIRKHPEIGHRILKDIPQLNDILPGVLYHHERWDGKGYPQGLQGDGIPLVARLIGLADSFDAMSSTRTYRSALSRAQVLAEIEKCSGEQFDPTLAKTFLAIDFTEYDRLAKEHMATEAAMTAGTSNAFYGDQQQAISRMTGILPKKEAA